MHAVDVVAIADRGRQLVVRAGQHAGLADAGIAAQLDRGADLAQRLDARIVDRVHAVAVEVDDADRPQLHVPRRAGLVGDEVDRGAVAQDGEGMAADRSDRRRAGDEAIVVRPFVIGQIGAGDRDGDGIAAHRGIRQRIGFGRRVDGLRGRGNGEHRQRGGERRADRDMRQDGHGTFPRIDTGAQQRSKNSGSAFARYRM